MRGGTPYVKKTRKPASCLRTVGVSFARNDANRIGKKKKKKTYMIYSDATYAGAIYRGYYFASRFQKKKKQ